MATSSSEHHMLQMKASEDFRSLSDKERETLSTYECKNVDWRASDAGKKWISGSKGRPEPQLFSTSSTKKEKEDPPPVFKR